MTKKDTSALNDTPEATNTGDLRPYHFPDLNRTIMATDAVQALELLNAERGNSDNVAPGKEGDGN